MPVIQFCERSKGIAQLEWWSFGISRSHITFSSHRETGIFIKMGQHMAILASFPRNRLLVVPWKSCKIDVITELFEDFDLIPSIDVSKFGAGTEVHVRHYHASGRKISVKVSFFNIYEPNPRQYLKKHLQFSSKIINVTLRNFATLIWEWWRLLFSESICVLLLIIWCLLVIWNLVAGWIKYCSVSMKP